MYPLQKLHRRYKEYTGRAFGRCICQVKVDTKKRS